MSQNRETRIKKRVQKRKKVLSKKEGLKAAAKRRGLQDEFEQLLGLQDTKLRALAKTITTIWNNQVALQRAGDQVEEMYCVMGRLLIPKMNEILIMLGSEDLITETTINGVFLTWHEFKKRPDFKAHFVPWFLGRDLSQLPPPSEPEAKEEMTDEAPALESGSPIEFGGDYAEGKDSHSRDETTTEEPRQDSGNGPKDEVPERQDPDSPIRGAGREENPTMP